MSQRDNPLARRTPFFVAKMFMRCACAPMVLTRHDEETRTSIETRKLETRCESTKSTKCAQLGHELTHFRDCLLVRRHCGIHNQLSDSFFHLLHLTKRELNNFRDFLLIRRLQDAHESSTRLHFLPAQTRSKQQVLNTSNNDGGDDAMLFSTERRVSACQPGSCSGKHKAVSEDRDQQVNAKTTPYTDTNVCECACLGSQS